MASACHWMMPDAAANACVKLPTGACAATRNQTAPSTRWTSVPDTAVTARDRCGAREQEEAAPAMQALHEWLDLAAGDPDALEPRERRLDGLRHALAPVPGERLAQARLRLERQELSALELADQVRDDVKVERAVFQDVGGGDLLHRGVAVHLLPEERLRLREHEEPLRRGVLEDERGLARHAGPDLGDLEGALGRAVGPRLDEAEGAADLADLEALVLATDEQLEFCGRGALAHRDSTSNPVASRPQRVASATWWVERLSRSMQTWTIA